MKIEIEVSDETIREAIEMAAIRAINTALGSWQLKDDVAAMVKQQWPVVAAEMIDEALRSRESLKSVISEEIGKRLRAQLSRAMKESGE